MSPVAAYAARLAALPGALAILELHPQGLPLSDLAAELGTSADDLREVFLAYYLADLVELGSFGQPVVEFFAPGTSDEDVDPTTAQWVRVVARDPEHELGVDHLSAEQLGRLHDAGADLLTLEPDNEELAAALDAFRLALWPVDSGPVAAGDSTARALHRAVQEHRRVRIGYVRQWHPGSGDRVIEPYRLVRTRRGWEVDAGPADDVAAVRTFLVSGIQDCDVLDERFDPPADVDDLVSAHRSPVAVDLVVPQDRRWAVERFAESTEVVQDDEESVKLTAALLPPVEQRLGQILLTCGPGAFVVAPRSLENSGLELARALLSHHRTTP